LTNGTISGVSATITYLNVTYSVTKTALDYDPMMFSDLDSVYQVYGVPDDDNDGVIENTLSVGADIFFSNSGGLLICVQSSGSSQSDYENALNKLENLESYCLVPLFDILPATSTFKNSVATHVNKMSSTVEKRERIAILGSAVTNPSLPGGLTDDPANKEACVAAYIGFIDPIDNARIGYMVPSTAQINIGAYTYPISGPYIACAIAGLICNPTVTSGEPISGKTIARISGLSDIYTRSQKNRMAAVGGMIIENFNGTYKVRHALSTNVSTPVNAELKITKIKDYVAKTVRSALDATFINTRNIGTETIAAITTATRLLLDGVITIKDIVAYENLQVKQNPSEPRQIDVSFMIRPTWDVNWILVTFGVTI